MPDISVLISTYNGEHTITRALRSVLNGTRASVEVCVCDDASTDNTLFAIRDALPQHNKNIRLTRHARNKGTAEGLNSAAKLAQGRYFIILGDDDHFQFGALDKLSDALKARDDIGFTYGATHYFGAQERVHMPPPFAVSDFWKSFVSLYAVMYKREAFDSGIRYRDLITLDNGRGLGACDYDFVLQMIQAGYTGLALPDVLVLNYLFNPTVRQTNLVNAHQAEMVAKFREQWAQWEGDNL
jgi:glycosyltransferase involved in cell wall biosynthesis